MAELVQNSYFGDGPDRLQKALQLDGTIPLKLQDAVAGVVLLADATGPGYNTTRGRRFAAADHQVGGANNLYTVISPSVPGIPVVIDRFYYQPGAAGRVRFKLGGNTVGAPAAFTGDSGFARYIERQGSIQTAEISPLRLRYLASAVNPWTTEVEIAGLSQCVAGQIIDCCTLTGPIVLLPGQYLGVDPTTGGAGETGFGVAGYTLF